MPCAIVSLTSIRVDNPATPSDRTRTHITLANSTGRLQVTDREASPRSVHEFVVRDSADVGFGSGLGLTLEQSMSVFAIACSLANQHILFSPLQPQFLPVAICRPGLTPAPTGNWPIDDSEETLSVEVSAEVEVDTVLTTPFILDEQTVLENAKLLLDFRLFSRDARNTADTNIQDAVVRYWQAIMTADLISCYTFLYEGFEKAVNADQDRTSTTFDRAAQCLTGVNGVADLRMFDNRIKHALRHHQDQQSFKNMIRNQHAHVLKLKKATDLAIITRVHAAVVGAPPKT